MIFAAFLAGAAVTLIGVALGYSFGKNEKSKDE